MAGLTPTETERIIELCRAINARGIAILLIEHVMRAVMALSRADRRAEPGPGDRLGVAGCDRAQLLAYHTAVFMGKDVDQPRNLAKSVTVE